jgi:hypothetical protein
MSNAPATGSHVDDGSELIRRAAEQALDRQTVNELFDPQLRELVDVVLIELGRRLARLN